MERALKAIIQEHDVVVGRWPRWYEFRAHRAGKGHVLNAEDLEGEAGQPTLSQRDSSFNISGQPIRGRDWYHFWNLANTHEGRVSYLPEELQSEQAKWIKLQEINFPPPPLQP